MSQQVIYEEEVIRASLDDSKPDLYIRAYHKAHSRLLAKAVVQNAEGWQSGLVDTEVSERFVEGTWVVRVRMKMTRPEEDAQ